MKNDTNKQGYIVLFVIVNFGMGSRVLKEAKALGASGGTIFLGRGTAGSHFLELLGLDEIKKEIVMIAASSELEDEIHQDLTEKFHLNKPNHGIAFSLDVEKAIGARKCECHSESKNGGKDYMEYEVIFTIVDRGFAEDVVDAAVSAGAEGGTIINARGAGSHENSKLFAVPLEPEKEIVMILIDKDKSDSVITSINDTVQVDKPGKGIMFTIDVNQVSGLRQLNKSSKKQRL